jgi:hypothetical protein
MPNLTGPEIFMLAVIAMGAAAWWADHRLLTGELSRAQDAVTALQVQIGILPRPSAESSCAFRLTATRTPTSPTQRTTPRGNQEHRSGAHELLQVCLLLRPARSTPT